jgi:hypothetical protein
MQDVTPEPSGPVASGPGEDPSQEERRQLQLQSLRSDPAALAKLRNDPDGCATLMGLAEHSQWLPDRMLATIYLAITFPNDPRVGRYLFDRLSHARVADRASVLAAILANHGHDECAMAQVVATFGQSPPGVMADLLAECLKPDGLLAGLAPMGIPEDAWADWVFAARSAPLHLLQRNDLQSLILDITRRDPDGPVERTFEHIVGGWTQRPPQPPARKAWVFEQGWDDTTRERVQRARIRAQFVEQAERETNPDIRIQVLKNLAKMDELYRKRPIPDTPPMPVRRRVMRFVTAAPAQFAAWAELAESARVLLGRIADQHPKWPSIDGYVQELDSIYRRRLPGWEQIHFRFDTDLERREERIVARMANFPDAAAVRRSLETLLFERPAIWPKVWDECDYTFEPVGWRRTAWTVLTASHLAVADAIELARRIIDLGPWDKEARKSKESIIAVVTAWPNDAQVLAFVAEAAGRAELGEFVRNDIAGRLHKAAPG